MLNKIYPGLLAAAAVVMCFLTFYANSWLGSIGSPQSALEGYYHYAGLGSTILVVSSIILLVLANVILWHTRRAWAMWATFAYFAIFVLLRTFWLEKTRYNFENSDSLFFTPVIGVILITVAGAVVFFNQFLNLRLQERMYPALSKSDETPEWSEEKPEN
jgi:uncharacterized membrane protein SirB2